MLHGAILLDTERSSSRSPCRGQTWVRRWPHHATGSPGCGWYLLEGAVMSDTRNNIEAVWAYTREFTVTEDHLKLLRHAQLYWEYGEGYGAPAICSKRPYGESYVERSIGEILDARDSDWEWEDGEKACITPEAEERFTRLHEETLIVLHIALTAGVFRPGRYIRDGNISWMRDVGWMRAEEEDAEPGRG